MKNFNRFSCWALAWLYWTENVKKIKTEDGFFSYEIDGLRYHSVGDWLYAEALKDNSK